MRLSSGLPSLSPDGLLFTYTHRSLQEYFAAYCASRLASANLPQILGAFAVRRQDQTFPLSYEINPDAVVREYILPKWQKYGAKIESSPSTVELLYLLVRSMTFLVEDGVARVTMISHGTSAEESYRAFHSTMARPPLRVQAMCSSSDKAHFGETRRNLLLWPLSCLRKTTCRLHFPAMEPSIAFSKGAMIPRLPGTAR